MPQYYWNIVESGIKHHNIVNTHNVFDIIILIFVVLNVFFYYIFQTAHWCLKTDPKDLNLCRYYLHILRNIVKKTVLRLWVKVWSKGMSLLHYFTSVRPKCFKIKLCSSIFCSDFIGTIWMEICKSVL